MSFTKIVHLGAGGDLGKPTLNKLVDSGKFEVTVLVRESSSYTSPFSTVPVKKVDLDNQESLVSRLQGAEVLLITVGQTPHLSVTALIDAAISAGVKRIIPNGFGPDLESPRTQIPMFQARKNIQDYLAEKASAGLVEYTSVVCGGFFDWGFQHPDWTCFDIPNRQVTLYDGGVGKGSWTTLDSVAQAVVGILSNPEATKNRVVRVHDFFVSPNEIVAELKFLTGSKFTVVADLDSKQAEADALAELGKGFSLAGVQSLIKALQLGKESMSDWQLPDDSELLGLQKKDLREEIKKVL